jgi:V/A-type H+-transporting ATPase subunit K
MAKRMASSGILLFIVGLTAVFFMFSQVELQAQDRPSTAEKEKIASEAVLAGDGLAFAFIAAMGAVGLSCLASSYALGRIGSAALGAMSEKPELGGRALIFLGLAEGIAIYGLIVAIMILTKI